LNKNESRKAMNKYVITLAILVVAACAIGYFATKGDGTSSAPLSREAWVAQEIRFLPKAADSTAEDGLDMSLLHWAIIEEVESNQSLPLQFVKVSLGGVSQGTGLLLARDEALKFYLVLVEKHGQKILLFACPNIYTSDPDDLVAGRVIRKSSKRVSPDSTG
jgi:hypothetical protein